MGFEALDKDVGLKPLIYPTDIMQKDGFYVTNDIRGTITISPDTRHLASLPTFYGDIFIARFPCEVLWIAVSSLATSSASLDVEKLTGSTAKGSGDSMLVTAFDMSSITEAATTKEGDDLSATKSNRRLDPNDRIGLDMTGTLTNLRGVSVTIYLKLLGKGNYR